MNGYLHREYAESLAEFGRPRELCASKGWILERPIPGREDHDAMGCYPIFLCQNWELLRSDLENTRDLVSLSLVTDPFGEYDEDYLHECFPEVARPFKQHFVVDLSRPLDSFVHSHHQRNARRALNRLQVERCTDPLNLLADWMTLYSTLIERHNITGLAAFSQESFSKQLQVPGLVAFRAVSDGVTVGMVLWYAHGHRSYYHLAAYSPAGYELRASFALFSYAIEYFAGQGIEWLNLGSVAGVEAESDSGLNRFKRGWSTGTRTAYLCGRIFDHERYREIVEGRRLAPTKYFPAYRAGEFS